MSKGFGQGVVIKRDDDGLNAKIYNDGSLRVSGDINLVNADIQIGAVEIKNSTTDDRAKVYSDGALRVSGDVNLVNADIEIGAVELKDATSDNRASITAGGLLKVEIGNATVPIDVSGDVTIAQTMPASCKVQIYGDDTTNAINTDSTGDLQVDVVTVPNINIAKIYDSVDVSGDVTVSGSIKLEDKTTAANKATVFESGAVRISGDVNLVNTDIEIGAVELKDGTSDNRVEVNLNRALKISGDISATDLDIRDLTIADKVTVGAITVPVGVSGDVAISSLPNINIAKIYDSVDVSGDVAISSLPNVSIAKIYDSVDVSGDVSISSLPNISIAKVYDSIDVSGDVTIAQNTPANCKVQIYGDDTTSAINTDSTGDLQVDIVTLPNVSIAKIYDSVDISGDVTVSATDLDIRDLVLSDKITIGAITTSIGISGDVSVTPKSGVAFGLASGDSIIGRNYIVGSIPGLFNITKNYATAQTNASIKAPGTGKRVLLKGVTFTTGVAGMMVISGDTNFISPEYQFAANGGAVLGDPLGIWQGAANENVRFTSRITGAHGVTIWGIEN